MQALAWATPLRHDVSPREKVLVYGIIALFAIMTVIIISLSASVLINMLWR